MTRSITVSHSRADRVEPNFRWPERPRRALDDRSAQIAVVRRGFADLRFYPMNRADLVFAVCRLMG